MPSVNCSTAEWWFPNLQPGSFHFPSSCDRNLELETLKEGRSIGTYLPGELQFQACLFVRGKSHQ